VDEIATLPGGFERAALVQLAVDGLVLGELLQLSPYTPGERSRLVKALIKAADQCGRMQ
jgi:Tetracyclin repressor-like, C-terminal domain